MIQKEREEFVKPKVKRKIFGIEVPHRFVVYDKLQRGTVFLLITAATVLSTRLIVDYVRYYRNRKPILLEKAKIAKEMEMTAMQAERDAASAQELLQAEADEVR